MTGENARLKDDPLPTASGTSQAKTRTQTKETYPEVLLIDAVMTYVSYGLLIFWGYVSDFLRSVGLKNDMKFGLKPEDDWFKMALEFRGLYNRNIYRRIRDCWNRPIASCPKEEFDLMERYTDDYCWTFKHTGRNIHCLNLGSYNYLGFSDNQGPCAEAAIESVYKYGSGSSSSRRDLGTLDITKELERTVARFVGKPDAICFSMGFATNSANLPALVGKGSLIVSDEHNHASIVLGAKLSGATIRVFKHNDVAHLESVLRRAIIEGQPRTHRRWKKILIIVEGVYSMEGTVPNLPAIIALKKKYKVYLYVDEAHSIGAIGPTGRGIVEYWGMDPADVDIMMGTFTKSFGSCGGYIAANHEVINHLRLHSHSATYGGSVCAPAAQQIITSMKIIMGEDGTDIGQKKIAQLLENSRYFRKRLIEMGFMVIGNEDSPVVPVLLYLPGKIAAFSRLMLERKIAVVVVGYPATSLVEARTRICLSAAHTREMLDFALKEIDDLGDELNLKRCK